MHTRSSISYLIAHVCEILAEKSTYDVFNKIYMYRVAVVSTHRKRAWPKDTMREIARERERERGHNDTRMFGAVWIRTMSVEDQSKAAPLIFKCIHIRLCRKNAVLATPNHVRDGALSSKRPNVSWSPFLHKLGRVFGCIYAYTCIVSYSHRECEESKS